MAAAWGAFWWGSARPLLSSTCGKICDPGAGILWGLCWRHRWQNGTRGPRVNWGVQSLCSHLLFPTAASKAFLHSSYTFLLRPKCLLFWFCSPKWKWNCNQEKDRSGFNTSCPGELWWTFGFGSATSSLSFWKTLHQALLGVLLAVAIMDLLEIAHGMLWFLCQKSKWMILLNLFCIYQEENLGTFWWVVYASPGSLADEFLIEELLELEFTGHYEEKNPKLLPIPLYDDAIYQAESSRTLK